jgi:hypothetical protein
MRGVRKILSGADGFPDCTRPPPRPLFCGHNLTTLVRVFTQEGILSLIFLLPLAAHTPLILALAAIVVLDFTARIIPKIKNQVGAPALANQALPSVQWPQTLERNEDGTGDQDGPDVEDSENDVDEVHDDSHSPRAP